MSVLQSSDDWAAARAGHVTASRVADVIAKSRDKKGWGVSRTNYAAELVAERLTGKPTESFKSFEMQRGTDTEPLARAAYSFRRGLIVTPAAFIQHPKIKWAGASPDGFVADDGLAEFKCPNTATHIETLLGGAIPNRYVTQVQWQMAVSGRRWCDFVSFDPRLPERNRLFVQRVLRDDDMIAALERHIVEFLIEVEQTISKLSATLPTPQPQRMAEGGAPGSPGKATGAPPILSEITETADA